MQKKSKSVLKKLILAIVVALGVAAATHFGFDISEKEIQEMASPLVEELLDTVTDEEVSEEPTE